MHFYNNFLFKFILNPIYDFYFFIFQSLSVAALFLAAKVEEQPRKLEHVIKVAHMCLHKDLPPLDVRTEVCENINFYYRHFILNFFRIY